MLLPYPRSPPHPFFNHRRCLQDDRLLMVGCRSDYANFVFIGASTSVLHKLERIQNTLARVVTRKHGRSSISAILHNLHWLPIKWRIDFKVATLTYKVLQSGEPSYLSSRIAIAIPRQTFKRLGVLSHKLKSALVPSNM